MILHRRPTSEDARKNGKCHSSTAIEDMACGAQ
jgi:hypothetical protein